jgi:hypothetical protein
MKLNSKRDNICTAIELTGIVNSERLNVLNTTGASQGNNRIPDCMLVIENIGIEEILMLQNTKKKEETFETRNVVN